MTAAPLAPLRGFVARLTGLLDRTSDEATILSEGGALLRKLIATDGWLPTTHAAPGPDRYRQYPLFRDPAGRFSVVSFVWGPGQSTPVHDHTVWGLVGVLRGAEVAERYERAGGALRPIGVDRIASGDVQAVSPAIGDLHRVANAHDDRVTISIHVYGGDIGTVERSIYAADGTPRRFVSGYADAPALDLAGEPA